MKIIIAADANGVALKDALRDHLVGAGFDVFDANKQLPDGMDYPDIALRVAEDIRSGRHDRGLLVCGTGIGMAIAANKVAGIRAALVADVYSAERAAKSNDAQIITLGSQTTGPETAKLLAEAYLRSEYRGGRSASKVDKIRQIERRYMRETPASVDLGAWRDPGMPEETA
jgi:ribose 5-phosphate isomerase B